MTAMRTYRTILKMNNPYYEMFDGFCFYAKNLYNCAVYHFRQAEFGKTEQTSYEKLDKLLKDENGGKDYRSIPLAWSAQHIIRLAAQNFKAYRKASEDCTKHPEKYLGRPRPPKYLDKEKGRQVFQVNYTKPKNGLLEFKNEKFKGFTLSLPSEIKKIQVVRIVPGNRHIVIEVVYNAEIDVIKRESGIIAGIDLGLDNLAAVVSNAGFAPVLINGKGLKSVNQYWNKTHSHYKSINDRMNGICIKTKSGETKTAPRSKREDLLTNKRNNRVKTFMHKASKKIIDILNEWNADTVVLGKNDGWKQKLNISRINNQKFVQIPYNQLIQMITYKAEAAGITVIKTEESYTSVASALDLDTIPVYQKNQKIDKSLFSGVRTKRGMYKSQRGILNADVNGALNIVRKVFPDAFSQGIEGCSNPVSVTIH